MKLYNTKTVIILYALMDTNVAEHTHRMLYEVYTRTCVWMQHALLIKYIKKFVYLLAKIRIMKGSFCVPFWWPNILGNNNTT